MAIRLYHIYMAINKKYAKRAFSFTLLLLLGLFQISFCAVHPALADESLFNDQEGISEVGRIFGDQKTDIRAIVGNLIQVILGLLAVIFLALTIFAGFRYMTANGNEDQTKKAIAQIRDSVIGLLIVLASWAITLMVLRLTSRSVNNSTTLWYR